MRWKSLNNRSSLTGKNLLALCLIVVMGLPIVTITFSSALAQIATAAPPVDYVTLSGEPLVLQSEVVEREIKYPVMLFEGDVAVEVHVVIQWLPDGTVKIADDRGYELSLAIPPSQGDVTLFSNSSAVVQRVVGKDAVYDIVWTPRQDSDKSIKSYKYAIYGKILNSSSSVISFDLSDLKFAELISNSLMISQPKSAADLERDAQRIKGTEKDWTNSAGQLVPDTEVTLDSVERTSLAPKDPQDLERDGLTINWTDAVAGGHQFTLNTETSKLEILPTQDPNGKFAIDPTVVGTIASSISPGIGNSFEGQVRLLSTGDRINAFYYDSSNIVYKTSDDKGKTWSASATSTGSGTLAADNYRWSLVQTAYNDTLYVSLLYWRSAGNNMNFYAMRGLINGSIIQSWDTPTLLGTTTENTAYCFNGSACPAVTVAIDEGGNIFAAFTWISGGATEYSYKILKSSDGGLTWSTSLPDVYPAGTTRPTMTLTALNAGKMLFLFGREDSASLFYRIYDGSTWGSQQTMSSNTNLATGTFKQISSASDGLYNAFVAYTNITNPGSGGILKLIKFSNDGTFQSVETADSTRPHRLPNAMFSHNGGLNIYTISGLFVYDTRWLEGVWEAPFQAFSTSLVSPNQLTAVNLFGDDNSGLWREGTASPYNLVFGLLREGTVVQTESKVSPSTSESFEGEHRIVATSNGTLFAFYHEGADIRYKTSLDGGLTWSGNPTSIPTGTVNSDDFRWSVVNRMNPTERISVIYYKQSSGDTDFKHKTYSISGRTLVETAGGTIFSAVNDASCSPAGVCASAVVSTDSNSTVLYAAFNWKSAGTWYYRIMTSTNGGSTWTTSLTSTSVSTSQKMPISLTYLGATKMLFAYSTYESSSVSYRVYDGSSWGSVQTLSGTGLPSNSVKQMSADSNSTGHVFLAFPAGGTSGTLKVARFSNNTGTSLGIDTANSTLSHSLPSVTVVGFNGVFVYTISDGKVYATQYFNGTWLASENRLLQDIAVDQLTTAYKYPVILVQEGAIAPHSLMTATDYVGLGEAYGVASPTPRASTYDPDPWIAAYDTAAKRAIYKARVTCNFSGTTASVIQTNNHLTCSIASTAFTTSIPRMDYAYQAYVTVLNSGLVKVGAEVWQSCTKYSTDNPLVTCNGFGAGKIQLQYQRTYVLGYVSLSTPITVEMEWSGDGKYVNWFYTRGSIRDDYGTFTARSHQQRNFITGTIDWISPDWCCGKVKYLQVGITSEYPISKSGFVVMIKNPGYATSLGGSYSTYFANAKSVRGDGISYFNGGFKWGGQQYSNSRHTEYDCAGSYSKGQVKYSYLLQGNPSAETQYWPC